MSNTYKPSAAVVAARRAYMAYTATLPKRITKAQDIKLSSLMQVAFDLEMAENPALRAEIAQRGSR